ncbi:MAG TPA: NAD-dependent epimerase/dehydratase family protein [Kofleriaceae bacterium]|nr:NAD-dependent epimerase/dehydratase family protein [Kofleriaceae bacterium]
MARILVIGGKGFLGRRVVDALESAEHDVAVAGRNGPVLVDLATGEGLYRMDDYDAVVNCSASTAAPADRGMARVLERGGLWLDAGADPDAVTRQLAPRGAPARGSVVLGVGLWPGMSNLLVADLARGHQGPLSLGIKVSPLSGAGRGTVELMRGALLGAPPAETLLFQASLAQPVAVEYLVPAPGRLVLALLARLRPRCLARAFAAAATGALRLARTVLLRRRAAPIELHARAGDATAVLATRDGFAATAAAIAASAGLLLERGSAPGVHTPDELLALDDVLARLPPGAVSLQRTARSRSSA